ncbi:hypothetical protein LUZ63_003471 [Rhynchospora breviuscula]|uniref:KIB1-4 beta-propeller domain-containing protein n=1 Tax=Rhynchospora breviuscula TaxID=2022672 RepID=A0A9Q0HZ18_9POAL|nr:hypothetical protein LUZ63_003471 [Rhynchospora breviuscula]
MFLVSVANSNEGQGFPASCTIHHVELSDYTWKHVESIGGCVFFLGGTQSSVLSPSQAGAQHDCIYIANQYYGEGIYKICMQDQTVSLSLLLKWPGRWRSQLCWLMPTRVYHSRTRKRDTYSLTHAIGTDKSDATHVHEEEKKEEKCKVDIARPWADMPIELVELLLRRLYLMDCLRLPSVCKAWNSLSNLIQSSKVHPWFMYTTNDKSCLWRLFDPVYGKEYSIDMTWLGFSQYQDISFQYSKDGWLLVLKEGKYLFLINPLTRECIDLPEKDHYCRFVGMSFSSSPTNSDCVVLVVSSYERYFLEISTWRPGEDEWSNMRFYYRFCCPVPGNPVFTGGKFYYYPFRGKLSVYDPNKRTLQTFKTKAPLEIDENATKIMRGYLMESMGDLITVFRENPEDRLRIFQLDQQKMAWSELDGLGDLNIFLNHRTSLAKPFLEKRCPNPIYFSQFADEHCKSIASYSLETNNCQPAERSTLKEPTNCIWIEHSRRA